MIINYQIVDFTVPVDNWKKAKRHIITKTFLENWLNYGTSKFP